MSRTERVAIVTGGSRGIGEAAARALAAAGIGVAVVARSQERVKHVAASIEDNGGNAVTVAADIGEPGAAGQITSVTEQHFGRPCDMLVNAAGITGPLAELSQVDPSALRSVVETNLLGAFALCHAVLPAMQANGWGRIVNVTSGLARRVQPGLGAYSTAKAALLHLSRIMDRESKERGVRVFALEPGVVRSNMNEQLREASKQSAVGASVAQMLSEMERDPGMVDAAESARLIRLVATGAADDLAGKAFSIYDPDVRSRIPAER